MAIATAIRAHQNPLTPADGRSPDTADAGLVAVHDMGMPLAAARILERLDDEGKLPVRAFVYLDVYLIDGGPNHACSVFSGPSVVSGANGSPRRSFLAAASSPDTNASWAGSSTRIRSPAVQLWPAQR